MEWYVLNYDFNNKMIRAFNVFNSVRFSRCVDKLLKNFVSMDRFKEDLLSDILYCFWCKVEYEISVGDYPCDNIESLQKLDVSAQLLPNINILAEYIVDYHNKHVDIAE